MSLRATAASNSGRAGWQPVSSFRSSTARASFRLMQEDGNMEKPTLQNARILILEDDYYLATDLQAALEAAGAQVVGPFADPADAAHALKSNAPNCALVDLNLGRGIDFELPQELARQSIPFAFVTGYDRDAIPDTFAGTARVEKPVAPQKVVEIVRLLLAV
ncbi:response regulator [Sphingomonas sp. NBWT7]|nr:response regulator [Sphingomonas sp. NBWT7]